MILYLINTCVDFKSLLVKRLVVILFCLFSLCAQALPQVQMVGIRDSLQLIANSDLPDTQKIRKLYKIGKKQVQDNKQVAIAYLNKALLMSTDINYAWGIIRANRELGNAYFYDEKYVDGIGYHKQALQVAELIRDKKEMANTLHNIATNYYFLGGWDQSLHYFYRALELYEQLNLQDDVAEGYSSIGNVYYNLKDFPNALKAYRKGNAVALSADNKKIAGWTIGNIAWVYLEMHQYDSTLLYASRALELAEFRNDSYSMIGPLFTLGLVEAEYNEFTKSYRYIERAIELAESIGDKNSTSESYSYLASVYAKQKKVAEAERYYLKALAIATEIDAAPMKSKALEGLYKLFKTKDPKQSLLYFEKFKVLSDSMLEKEKQRRITEATVRFESDKKEKQIASLMEQDRSRQKQLWLIIGASVLSILTLGLLYTKRTLQQKLAHEREVLLQSEKNRLIAEEKLHLEEKRRIEAELVQHKGVQESLQNELDGKNRELVGMALLQTGKESTLNQLKELLGKISDVTPEEAKRLAKESLKIIQQSETQEGNWEGLKLHFEKVHPGFFEKLLERAPNLTANELKHCAYMHINLSNKEVGNLLNVDASAVKMMRYRIKKKLGLEGEDSLSTFVNNL